MGKKAQYLTMMKFCKNCSTNLYNNPASMQASKALRCPNCGSMDRTKFKRSK